MTISLTSNKEKKQKDFSSVYALKSNEQLALNRDCLKFEILLKECKVALAEKHLELKEMISQRWFKQEAKLQVNRAIAEILLQTQKDRATLLTALVQQGKAGQEIEEYLKLLQWHTTFQILLLLGLLLPVLYWWREKPNAMQALIWMHQFGQLLDEVVWQICGYSTKHHTSSALC